MTFIHDRPDGPATEPTERGRRNYPPDGSVPLEGVKLVPEEPDVLFCTCTETCKSSCAGEMACPGFCEACHYVQLRAEEEGSIEAAGKTRQ